MSQKKEKLLTKDFICITLISFFMFAVFYVLLTTLPLYLSVELHASADRAGLLVTLFLPRGVMGLLQRKEAQA